jgi:hypothetical protein
MQHDDATPWQYVGPIHFSPKEKLLPHIGGIRIVGGDSHSSPWLTLTKWLTKTWLVYLQKSAIDIYSHTSPLIHQVTPTRLTLCGQHCICYENVFTSCWRHPQDIPRSPHTRCVVMASCMIDTQPIPHDRDCPQASLVFRGWVRNSHHPAGGYIPWRRCVITE